MWIKQNFFKYSTAIIMLLTIILLTYYASPVFSPLMWFVTAVLLPVLFSAMLYYIIRPLVYQLVRFRVPKYLAILLVYLGIVLLSLLIGLTLVPKVATQVANIADVPPEKIEALKQNTSIVIEKVQRYVTVAKTPAVEEAMLNYVQKINPWLYKLAYNTLTTMTSIAIALILTPFVLFYFLRDDELFVKYVLRFVPENFQLEVKKTLNEVDQTLSGFIIGQMSIALLIGIFLYIGYSIIGLHEALSLALLAMVFYVVPILGTFIALVPAFIVGLSVNLTMALKVLAVMYLAHLFEGNLLTPRIMSQRLHIHPLTIILLLLAAGTLYGLIGLILVTPTYAMAKVIVWNMYKMSQVRYHANKSSDLAK